MKKFYAIYRAPYGLSVKYLGEFKSDLDVIIRERIFPIVVLEESELRAFMGSIQNELTKS